jgi:2-dehydropantoate 2-reductase
MNTLVIRGLLKIWRNMRYAMIGAGNIGCLYGSNLARIGHDVTLIDINEEHIMAIDQNGLAMEGLHGEFVADLRATTDVETVSDIDTALICVNGYSTQNAARTAEKILNTDGFVVSLQNGVGNIETLTEVLGANRVLGGLSFHSGDMQGPGHVRHTNEGSTFLGEIDRSRTERVEKLAQHLDDADMLPVIEPDIMQTIWSKFVHNCGINAICALTDLRPGHIQDVPELDDFQRTIIQETLDLVNAKGVKLDDPDPVETIREYCATKFNRVSMAQHLAREVRTEIDSLNGYVASESPKFGLHAPASDALSRLIKGREYLPSGIS